MINSHGATVTNASKELLTSFSLWSSHSCRWAWQYGLENWTLPVTQTPCESLAFSPPPSCPFLSMSLPVFVRPSMTPYMSFRLSPSPYPCRSVSVPAPFIGLYHWAMCAVPVSKTAGRLSSFSCWRMWSQCSSCESYRLGSVKALPVGKAAASCLSRWQPHWACLFDSENVDIHSALL